MPIEETVGAMSELVRAGKAIGLPGAAEVRLIWGRREGGSFNKALMCGLPADGTWRKLTRSRRWGGLSSAI